HERPHHVAFLHERREQAAVDGGGADGLVAVTAALDAVPRLGILGNGYVEERERGQLLRAAAVLGAEAARLRAVPGDLVVSDPGIVAEAERVVRVRVEEVEDGGEAPAGSRDGERV